MESFVSSTSRTPSMVKLSQLVELWSKTTQQRLESSAALGTRHCKVLERELKIELRSVSQKCTVDLKKHCNFHATLKMQNTTKRVWLHRYNASPRSNLVRSFTNP